MHNNYYFLKTLTPVLESKIKGCRFTECFSQSKDELIIEFTSGSEGFYIKAHMSSNFSCLSFTDNFQRAKKNSINLFNEIIDKKVIGIRQYLNERCFSILFKEDYHLLFKMHGNRSNLILFKHNQIISIFNNSLKNDWDINIDKLDRRIDQSQTAFINTGGDYKILFPTFGKEIKMHLSNQNYESADLDLKWNLILEVLKQLNSHKYFVTSEKLLLIPIEKAVIHDNPISAINDFFLQHISTSQIDKEKKFLLSDLENSAKKGKSYLSKAEQKLDELENKSDYRQIGDLIMANLHAISPNNEHVELMNFYDNNNPIIIKLKRTLTPQKNAEGFYRKAKNKSIETKNLSDTIERKKGELTIVHDHIKNITSINNLKILRQYIKDHALIKVKKEQEEIKPYNRIEFDNFEIWVGKNAQSNDKMLQYTFKEDLWLHAKDVSGSHVIIKYNSSQKFTNTVKEKAAQLAAFYSKRKTDSLCPVIITPRKYVRKRKGDAPGAVVVDREEVLLVVPQKWY